MKDWPSYGCFVLNISKSGEFFAVLVEDGKEMSIPQEQGAFMLETGSEARPPQIAFPIYAYLRFPVHGNSEIKSTKLSEGFVLKEPVAK